MFTVSEFYADDIIRNLVGLLGISEDQIRVVNVVRETSTRRKRQTESVNSFSVSKIGHVNNIFTMEFFTGISRNTYILSLSGNSKICVVGHPLACHILKSYEQVESFTI